MYNCAELTAAASWRRPRLRVPMASMFLKEGMVNLWWELCDGLEMAGQVYSTNIQLSHSKVFKYTYLNSPHVQGVHATSTNSREDGLSNCRFIRKMLAFVG